MGSCEGKVGVNKGGTASDFSGSALVVTYGYCCEVREEILFRHVGKIFWDIEVTLDGIDTRGKQGEEEEEEGRHGDCRTEKLGFLIWCCVLRFENGESG